MCFNKDDVKTVTDQMTVKTRTDYNKQLKSKLELHDQGV